MFFTASDLFSVPGGHLQDSHDPFTKIRGTLLPFPLNPEQGNVSWGQPSSSDLFSILSMLN